MLRLTVLAMLGAMLRPSSAFGVARSTLLLAPSSRRALHPVLRSPGLEITGPTLGGVVGRGRAFQRRTSARPLAMGYTEDKVVEIDAQLKADDPARPAATVTPVGRMQRTPTARQTPD